MSNTATYVLMAGLPATGKTTLAKALAAKLDGVVLNKDEVRAALFPGALTDYTTEQDDLVFNAILQAANYLASRQRAGFIFLDGRTFSRREQVEVVLRAAASAGASWKILYTTVPENIAEARIAQDAETHPAANRTVSMYRELKTRFEPIEYPFLEVAMSLSLDVCVSQALAYLIGPAAN